MNAILSRPIKCFVEFTCIKALSCAHMLCWNHIILACSLLQICCFPQQWFCKLIYHHHAQSADPLLSWCFFVVVEALTFCDVLFDLLRLGMSSKFVFSWSACFLFCLSIYTTCKANSSGVRSAWAIFPSCNNSSCASLSFVVLKANCTLLDIRTQRNHFSCINLHQKWCRKPSIKLIFPKSWESLLFDDCIHPLCIIK